jgi:transposase InsO family protein
VIDVLEDCFKRYATPRIIRTDQGPEFRSKLFEKFVQQHRIKHEFTEKGSPWQNGNLESFAGKLRDECLNRNIFNTLATAKEVIEKYRNFYNNHRPHSSLHNKVPYEVYLNKGS